MEELRSSVLRLGTSPVLLTGVWVTPTPTPIPRCSESFLLSPLLTILEPPFGCWHVKKFLLGKALRTKKVPLYGCCSGGGARIPELWMSSRFRSCLGGRKGKITPGNSCFHSSGVSVTRQLVSCFLTYELMSVSANGCLSFRAPHCHEVSRSVPRMLSSLVPVSHFPPFTAHCDKLWTWPLRDSDDRQRQR